MIVEYGSEVEWFDAVFCLISEASEQLFVQSLDVFDQTFTIFDDFSFWVYQCEQVEGDDFSYWLTRSPREALREWQRVDETFEGVEF